MATIKNAIIIGGGIAGPAAALALSQIGITSTIYELRDSPATIGGAINITPNALRVLDHFGLLERAMQAGCPCEKIEVFSLARGQRIGEFPFGSVKKHGYSSLRIARKDLQHLLLSAVAEAGIDVQYNKKLVNVQESTDSITAIFEDGTSTSAGLLLGCDGIHSAVRTQFVEPSRVPTYTGISSAYGILPASPITEPIPFESTALGTSCNGSLLISYCNPTKTSLFLAAVIKTEEQQDRDGWRVRGKAADDTRQQLLGRFESAKLPWVRQMTNATEELFFYPVFTLDNGGLWSRGRALLIGDAAHAMPPGGQSVGLALEDVALLARFLDSVKPSHPQDIFPRYEKLRRPHVDHDYKRATQRMEGVTRISWWSQWIREMMFSIILMLFASRFDDSFAYDVFKDEL